jgi:hypothetical protein
VELSILCRRNLPRFRTKSHQHCGFVPLGLLEEQRGDGILFIEGIIIKADDVRVSHP